MENCEKSAPRIRGAMGRARWSALGAAVAALLCLQPLAARAAYPDRNILLLVPFAPGGPTDIIARIISAAFQKSLGQSVIVDNRGGAAGNIGMSMAARAAPDGYTLLLTSTAIAVNPALFNNLGYDPFKDFVPISELVNAPNVIVVRADSGITSIADLVARAKAAPNTFNYASPGVGTKSHLSGEQLKLRAGIQMTHVPYRGAGPAALAVLEGTTQVGSVALAAAEPLVKSGQLRALAVTGAKRWFSLPDVPTMVESGLPGFVSDTFNALVRAGRYARPDRGDPGQGKPGIAAHPRGAGAGTQCGIRGGGRYARATLGAPGRRDSGGESAGGPDRHQA